MKRAGDSKTTADVAVTGKARPLDLSAKDRERLFDPLPLEQQNLHLPDKHN